MRSSLAELGYVEGKTILLEFRFAAGDPAILPQLVAELIGFPVDVLVVDGGIALAHAVAATKTIPIVIASAGDPVRLGYVSSLARPGGNVTGFTLVSTDLNLKRLELLRAAVPEARTLAVLFNPTNLSAVDGLAVIVEAARGISLDILPLEARTPLELKSLRLPNTHDVPLLVLPDAMYWNNRHLLIETIQRDRRAALYPEREYAESGGLIAYGPNVPDNFRRAAGYIDRILKGAQPGELPIQQPSRFDFLVNMKTARALGLTLPTSFVVRADEVIE